MGEETGNKIGVSDRWQETRYRRQETENRRHETGYRI